MHNAQHTTILNIPRRRNSLAGRMVLVLLFFVTLCGKAERIIEISPVKLNKMLAKGDMTDIFARSIEE